MSEAKAHSREQARYGGLAAWCFRHAVLRLYWFRSAKVVVAALRTSHV